jgi:hypothetical protein
LAHTKLDRNAWIVIRIFLKIPNKQPEYRAGEMMNKGSESSRQSNSITLIRWSHRQPNSTAETAAFAHFWPATGKNPQFSSLLNKANDFIQIGRFRCLVR